MADETTNTENVETVENSEPRDLNTLLTLETYQGMTDEEIELVMQYRAQLTANNSAIDELHERLTAFEAIKQAYWVDNTRTCNELYSEQIEAARKRLDASYNLDFTETVEPLTVDNAEVIEEVTEILE